jgi:hypothetical protein
MSKPNGSGILGGFFGGRAPLRTDPISQFPFFAASRHFDIGEEAFFLFGWDLVVSDMACHSRAVVVAVAFNVPPCAHLDLSVPDWPFVRELFAESVFPRSARCHFEILILCRVLNKIIIAILVLSLLLVVTVSYSVVSCYSLHGLPSQDGTYQG